MELVFQEIEYVNKNNKRTRNDAYLMQVPFGTHMIWKDVDQMSELDYEKMPVVHVTANTEEEMKILLDISQYTITNLWYPYSFSFLSYAYKNNTKNGHYGAESRIK